MILRELYQPRDLLTGLLIYGCGDLIAALLTGQFSVSRLLGMSAVGALVYGLEIPHYFRWVARYTAGTPSWRGIALRTLLAMLYFNPLWVARHLAFIALVSGNIEQISLNILSIALHSFLTAIPITVIANFTIQNRVPLTHRFMASALFSCFMAIYYPLVARWVGT